MKISLIRPALCAGALAFGILSPCHAADPIQLPLPEDVLPALRGLAESALAKSPRTMARDFDLLNAQYQEMISASRLYPQLGGAYQYQLRDEQVGERSGRRTLERIFFDLSASQAVWHWGTVRAGARIGELGRLIAEKNLEAARRGLILEVRETYLGLIVQKMGVRNVRINKKMTDDLLLRQEARFKAGEITASVLSVQRLQAEEATLAVRRAEADLEFAVRAFRRLAGVEGFAERDIPDAIPVPPAGPGDLSTEENNGYLRSASLIVNEIQIAQEKLNTKIERKFLWPKLSAIAGVTQDNNLFSTIRNQRINNTVYFAGIQVQWTFFDGFASRGRRLQSLNRARLLKDTRSDLMETLKNSTDQQAVAVELAWSAFRNMDTRRKFAEGNAGFVKSNLAIGQASEDDLATAEAGLNQAELVATDALAKFYTAAARYASTVHADPILD